MKSKEVAIPRSHTHSTSLSFDRVLIASGFSSITAVWFVWHFIFDLVLQVTLGVTVLVLWIKNLQLKRQLNKLESSVTSQ